MSARFELPSELTVYTAQDTLAAFRAWRDLNGIDEGVPISIAAHKVSEVDGWGLQFLASLRNTGYPWTFSDVSVTVENACSAMGLKSWLKDASEQKDQEASP
jgi:hypothetical protein